MSSSSVHSARRSRRSAESSKGPAGDELTLVSLSGISADPDADAAEVEQRPALAVLQGGSATLHGNRQEVQRGLTVTIVLLPYDAEVRLD